MNPIIETSEYTNSITKSDYYYVSRKTREFIIENNIKELPVNLEELVKNNGWMLASYSQVKEYGKLDNKLIDGNWGITIFIQNKYLILFDDKISQCAKRFTIAHEIGHIVLSHKDNLVNEKTRETLASMFAARLLMPMCVLYECKVKSPEEIQEMCLVSLTAATYRYNRLKMLKYRNKFYTDKLEVLVRKQFKTYIKGYNKKHNKFLLFKKFYNRLIEKYSSLL